MTTTRRATAAAVGPDVSDCSRSTVCNVTDAPPPHDHPDRVPPPPPPTLTRPPGYAAYQSNPTPTVAVRRIGTLGKAITIGTAIVAIGTVISALLSNGLRTDAANFLAGSTTNDEFQSAIAPLTSSQAVTSVATITTGVLTIIWMFRIAGNVRSFGRITTWSPLFAIFGWFLPPMVLYIIPLLVLRELWKASEPSVVDGTDTWKRSPDNPLLWVWFVLFGVVPAILLAVQIGSFASSGLPSGNLESVAKTLDDYGTLGYLSAVLNVAAATVWIMFVRQLTQRHRQLTSET